MKYIKPATIQRLDLWGGGSSKKALSDEWLLVNTDYFNGITVSLCEVPVTFVLEQYSDFVDYWPSFSRDTACPWHKHLHSERAGCGQWNQCETKVHLLHHSSPDVGHGVVELSRLKLSQRGVGK